MLARSAIISLVVLLVWGNAVAGLKVGLACPDWPLCHGEVIPPFRWDIYAEFLHRVIGAFTAVLIVWLSVRRIGSYSASARVIPFAAIFLLAAQIVLGGIVVLMKLPTDLTTVHFANGAFIFCITLYMCRFESGPQNSLSLSGIPAMWLAFAATVFFQGVLGAFVRHSHAGMACGTDFPQCLGFWIPPEMSGGVLYHFLHRTLGYAILIFSIGMTAFSYFGGKAGLSIRKPANIVLGSVLFQIIIGVGMIHSGLQFAATAAHLLVALHLLSFSLLRWFESGGKPA